ncbi:uncharacterized protein STEHIDRAFT_115935 [Stereum hirsutum FP-91666 SS1]|uniref:Uncharacterized protein n=1 Tax=Stereum hirsutum (strain FP-91666) TaxID=721885 RepID=R7S1R6_STEHR|nr:uncharacterized protein STEHIDRAFT_115935 [Stereum hirsutum FP-91666 SS1]EIM80512.1 hypothetical protein STEHIDRAFT_115935 [Stereum hirsutum FP-91666 SS1]
MYMVPTQMFEMISSKNFDLTAANSKPRTSLIEINIEKIVRTKLTLRESSLSGAPTISIGILILIAAARTSKRKGRSLILRYDTAYGLCLRDLDSTPPVASRCSGMPSVTYYKQEASDRRKKNGARTVPPSTFAYYHLKLS